MDAPKLWMRSELSALERDDDDPPARIDVFTSGPACSPNVTRRMTWSDGRVRTWHRDGNRYVEQIVS